MHCLYANREESMPHRPFMCHLRCDCECKSKTHLVDCMMVYGNLTVIFDACGCVRWLTVTASSTQLHWRRLDWISFNCCVCGRLQGQQSLLLLREEKDATSTQPAVPIHNIDNTPTHQHPPASPIRTADAVTGAMMMIWDFACSSNQRR